QRRHVWERRSVRRASDEASAAGSAQEWFAVGDQLAEPSGVQQDLTRQGMERSHLDRRRGGHERGQTARDSAAKLLGGIAVEGQHCDPLGRYAASQEMPKAGNKRRRLDAYCWGDVLRWSVRQGGCSCLLRIEARKHAGAAVSAGV